MSKKLKLIAEHHISQWSKSVAAPYAICWCGEQFASVELHAAHVVEMLSEHGYSIVHHRPTCAEAGDDCKHLPECVMAMCVCGEEWPCPTLAAAAEEDQ